MLNKIYLANSRFAYQRFAYVPKKSSLKPRDVRVHVFDARLRAECVHLGVTFIGVEGGSWLHAPKRTVLILYVMHPLVKQSSIVFTFLAWPISGGRVARLATRLNVTAAVFAFCQ